MHKDVIIIAEGKASVVSADMDGIGMPEPLSLPVFRVSGCPGERDR
ncbi:hypothetical protein ACVIHI_008019 [Bradyrhizobium sp. USDA 4524]|nr:MULTISPECIES: hypothetical protein [unclassified Bradyrhizobium]MCP1839064.1 hypothetical protein [Bradyrhizobium sp. USDA 4538]MCP1899630.1 hypothetical protein [Bradyrhizobium sp. USDA 4537]MCP1986261.1 hypothetical protein [Bradyrhizobium sp. USDA 4539]